MKQSRLILLFALCLLVLCSACKKQENTATSSAKISMQDLAVKSLKGHDDWTKDLGLYTDSLVACAKAAPAQTKYIFRADAFEKPSLILILLKTEDDKIYACSFEENDPKPHFEQIQIKPSQTAPRFYPGVLPKADSCLRNSKVVDNSGRTVGWLAKIAC